MRRNLMRMLAVCTFSLYSAAAVSIDYPPLSEQESVLPLIPIIKNIVPCAMVLTDRAMSMIMRLRSNPNH